MYLLDDIWKMANELMIESEIWEHNLNTSALYELSTDYTYIKIFINPFGDRTLDFRLTSVDQVLARRSNQLS